MAPAHETVIRAVGMALASTSAAFAIYMLAYGAGKTRINGMEHLAIFAQPRGPGGAVRGLTPPSADASTAVDLAATGSLAASRQTGAGGAAGRDRRRRSRSRLAENRWRDPHGGARRQRRGLRPNRGDRRARRRLGPPRRQGRGASRGRERRERRLALHPQANLRVSHPKRCRGNWARVDVALMPLPSDMPRNFLQNPGFKPIARRPGRANDKNRSLGRGACCRLGAGGDGAKLQDDDPDRAGCRHANHPDGSTGPLDLIDRSPTAATVEKSTTISTARVRYRPIYSLFQSSTRRECAPRCASLNPTTRRGSRTTSNRFRAAAPEQSAMRGRPPRTRDGCKWAGRKIE